MTVLAGFALALILQADFAPNATLPKKNVFAACGGENVSPALRWSNVPAQTRSFALSVFDPDASGGGFWHWIAYDIEAGTRALPANAGARPSPSGGKFATNDFGHSRYDGPCPPPGPPHHYVFTLYALNVAHLSVTDGAALESALAGHVIARARITARWGR